MLGDLLDGDLGHGLLLPNEGEKQALERTVVDISSVRDASLRTLLLW
jgi:hypothetical protein